MDKWRGLGYNSKEVAEALFNVTGGDKRKLVSRATETNDSVWGQAAQKLFPNRTITEGDRVNLYMIWRDNRKDIWNEYDELVGRRRKPVKIPLHVKKEENLCVCEKTTQRLPRNPRIYCNKCNRNLHYACADVTEATIAADFICGFCTGELSVPPMFDDTNNTGEQPFDKTQAYKCGSSHEFSDEDGDFVDENSTDESIQTDSENSECELGNTHLQRRSSKPSFSSSSSLDNLRMDDEQEEPSPAYSPFSTFSTKTSNLSIQKGDQASDFNVSQTSGHKNTEQQVPSIQDDDFSCGNISDLEDISSDDDVWRSPSSLEASVAKRKRSPTDLNKKKNYTDKSEACSPVKKGPKVSIVDSTFVNLSDFTKGLETKDSFQSQSQRKSKETQFRTENLGFESDEDFEDFKIKTPTRHSTPRVGNPATEELDTEGGNVNKKLDSLKGYSRPKSDDKNTSVNAEIKVSTKKTYIEAKKSSMDKETSNDSESDESHSAERRPRYYEDPNFDRGKKLDTSKVPSEFKMKISCDDWRNILVQKPNTTGKFKQDFKLVENYMDELRLHFSKVNPFCTPTHRTAQINCPIPGRSNHNFIRISAACSRYPCTTQWRFTVKTKPTGTKDAVVNVIRVGDIEHYANIIGRTRWKGKKQRAGRMRVKDSLPYTEYCKAYDNADPELLNAGNYSEVPKITSWQHMRVKKLAELDRDKDVYQDIAKTKWDFREKFPDSKIPGYIQKQSSEPAKFILYTKRQMNILQTLQQQGHQVMLQIDATGCLVRSLPWPYDGEPLMLYTVIMRSPTFKIHMPLTEMLTTDIDSESVQGWLKEYFKCFQKVCKIRSSHYGISKIEMDFSKVLIIATVNVFTKSTLEEYLMNMWNLLTGEPGIDARMFPIHVCRVHVVKAIRGKLRKIYYSKKGISEEYKIMMLWTQRFVLGRSMSSFERRLQDVGILCGFKYTTGAVTGRVNSMNEPTKKSDLELWKTVETETEGKTQFWRRSPFGTLADVIFQLCEQKNAECIKSNAKLRENPFYSPKFLNYIKVYISPYYPIISHCVFTCCNTNSVEDTTNPIEQYHGLLKNNVHKFTRNQKASRFLRKQGDFINGLCKIAETGLGIIYEDAAEKDTTGNENIDDPNDDSDEVTCTTDAVVDQEPDWGAANQIVPNLQAGKGYKSPQKEKEIFKKPFKRVGTSTYDLFTSVIPVVRWGSEFVSDNNRVCLSNTCSIDTTLQVLIGLYRHHSPFSSFLSSRAEADPVADAVQLIVAALLDNDISKAKTVWIREVLKLDVIDKSKNGSINLEASEDENGYGKIQHWIVLSRYLMCGNKKCDYFVNPEESGWNSSDLTKVEFTHIGDIYEYEPERVLKRLNETSQDSHHCNLCNSKYARKYALLGNPSFFFYPLAHNYKRNFPERMLPLTQKIHSKTYKVFAYTVICGDLGDGTGERPLLPHYVTVFVHDKKRIVFDGLMTKPYLATKMHDDWRVTSVWLIAN